MENENERERADFNVQFSSESIRLSGTSFDLECLTYIVHTFAACISEGPTWVTKLVRFVLIVENVRT